jgi:hypothetical protein
MASYVLSSFDIIGEARIPSKSFPARLCPLLRSHTYYNAKHTNDQIRAPRVACAVHTVDVFRAQYYRTALLPYCLRRGAAVLKIRLTTTPRSFVHDRLPVRLECDVIQH